MAAKYRYNLSPYNIIRPEEEHGEDFETAEGILSVVIGGDEIPVSEYRNFYIDHKQDGRDWLGFTLAVDSELYRGISEETKVRYRGVDYLCKKISDGHIECEIDLDFLRKGFHETFTSAKPLSSLLADILPVGWTAHGAVLIHGSPTIELETCTDLDILTEAQTEYRCWFSWNHEAKICTVVSADAVVRTGEYVTDELNLRTLSFKGSSVNFCTRLYAYGKSGASIDSVNGGKKYIDDFSYSSKLIVGYFKCDYELPANILKAAQYELSLRSHPERSYECDVVDLAKLSDEYDFLDFQLHRTVTLIDTRRGINVDHRIVEYVEYPDEPARNTVTLARAVRKMAQIKEVIKNSVDEVKIQIAEVNAAVAQDVATIQANISEINASVNTVANDVATLNTTTASLSSRQDRTETAQASLTQTVASQGATINGVVTWQATTYVNDRQETANALAAINQTATSQGASISLLTTWKDTTYVNDRKQTNEALAAINVTANSHGAAIESLTTWKSTTYENDKEIVEEAIAAINQTATSQGASISLLTEWKASTVNALAAINQTASSQGAAITQLVEWKTSTVNTIAAINQTANNHEAAIETLTQWKTSTAEALVSINQTANAHGASLSQLLSWKTEAVEAIVSMNRAVTNHGVSIEEISTWKTSTADVMVTMRQTINDNVANINELTTWKTSTSETVAGVVRTATDAYNAVGFLVESTANGHKVKGNIVIGAINDEIDAQIVADRINFAGFTTFVRPSDLEGGGSVTTINGGLITTETIDVGSIKKSTVTNGSRAVVFDVGIQTSYVRTNDITATGQLNLGGTLVSVASALTVKGKNVLVEGDIDLTGYATQTWSNNAFAVKDHVHSGHLNYSSANTTTLVVKKAGSTDSYNIALVGHGHSDYALSNHTHTGYISSGDLTAYASQTWVNRNFAASDHKHTDALFFGSTLGTNLTLTRLGSVTNTSYTVALANHTHTGMEVDYTDLFKFKSAAGANVTVTKIGAYSNTDYTFPLANHTHSGYAASDHEHSGYALANHTHTGYISASDISGHMVYSGTSGATLILTSGTSTKINVALANHTHDTDIVDHMLFGSTTGTNITLKRIGAYSNTNYTFALANHTHAGTEVNYTDLLKFKSTTGANITLTKIGAYSNTDYTFSLANHTHTGMEVNYANLLQVVNTNATTGVVNAKYVSYTTYGTSSTVSLSLALWSSNSGGTANTTDFMKFKSTLGANITLTKKGAVTDTDYTFSLANHTHSAYVSTGDLNGKWYVNINGTKYYLRSP
jgi:hypothetical protein